MIPSLLITTSAPDLEKSIEEGGALSGRINAATGTNHLVDSLSKGLPIEHAHKAFKRETVPEAGRKVRVPEKDPEEKREEREERREAGMKSVDQALDDIQKSCGSLKPAATDTDVKPRRKRLQKGTVFIIDPSRDKKDPLLAGGHGEEFHTDADKETVDFLTSTGSVNPDDPVHNPPVTPELNGFPLAVPTFYCSLSASDLLKAEEEKSLMQKAFNW